ncbi:TadE/TadG family type IV pilus assembly protein [Phyllobacterium endophyticum]|uniref:Pilus assembly protein n=1 Tax=Phyllobacterium endophyticum TaxID=1149773 RepID=A0A2P7AUT9_9HYPH|nr:TadE/TadG family type IV pilus assembly protein [Phyllobacterium endophyticum]MBB3234498.1 Flp pilus assembly protein TadG [Phyllobacterium endophyticum]PSH57992.1 pilus assembly protein [Phyllobacterium endophyticum]TYR38660.1 pilus assembly protein [Phyllobacterium endophyticum]
MKTRTPRKFGCESGVAAIEFALIAPILCLLSLGIIDGWSLASSALSMRAGVKTAANMVMQGASDDAAIERVALASWDSRPADAQVLLTRIYMCGDSVVTSSMLCEGSKTPSILIRIQAQAMWTAPYDLDIYPVSRELSHEQVIRVR